MSDPISPLNFPDALCKGLGRAVDYIRTHGDVGVEDAIIEAISEDQGYDTQSEGGRGIWLYNLIACVLDPEPYRRTVLELLAVPQESTWDAQQHLDIALEFARRGDAKMREAMYRMFERQEHFESRLGGDQIIALDGLNGLVRVADIVGRAMLADPTRWEDGGLLHTAAEQLGEREVNETLERAAATSMGVRTYLEKVEENRAQRSDNTGAEAGSESRAELDMSGQIDALIASGKQGRRVQYAIRFRAQRLSDDEMTRCFNAMLAEDDPKHCMLYMNLFLSRPAPGFDSRLVEWARSSDEELRDFARQVLGNTRHPEARRFADELLASDEDDPIIDALPIIIANYEPTEAATVEALLAELRDNHYIHYAGLSILRRFKEHGDRSLVPALLLLYEQSTCGICRHKALQHLIRLESASMEILREALSDCHEETRELAAGILSGK